MLTVDDAVRLAQEFLTAKYPAGGVVVDVAATIERPYGWIISYNTSHAIQTRDPGQGLIGNGPLLVKRADGRIIRFPSLYSARAAVDAYEEDPDRFPPVRS